MASWWTEKYRLREQRILFAVTNDDVMCRSRKRIRCFREHFFGRRKSIRTVNQREADTVFQVKEQVVVLGPPACGRIAAVDREASSACTSSASTYPSAHPVRRRQQQQQPNQQTH